MGLFFNVRQPRKFSHTPIYFDPQKEALEERILKKKKELGLLEETEHINHIRGSIIEASRHVRRRKEREEKSSTSTNIKIAVVLAILLVLFYWFYIR